MTGNLSKAGTWKNLAVAAALLSLGAAGAASADILVVAPHPDDDIITSAGVIVRALDRGETVHVVFMTNGDVEGTAMGLLRQDEAVAAQAELGVQEDHLIFLGYPDTSLRSLFYEFPDQTDVLNHNGQTTTYGARGLGFADYHTYRFGAPADYNAYNLTHDLADILWTFRPEHVFVTSEWDAHSDHAATYAFVRAGLDLVRASDALYDPTIHKTIVWSDESWPNPPSPITYFTPVPTVSAATWALRESLDVPLALQSIDLAQNPKYQAIARHASQGSNGGYIGRFVHKDENFWPEQAGGNRPPVPNAGLDDAAPRNAIVTLNGTASFDPDGGTLTYLWAQVAGYPVVLSDPASSQPTFVVPGGLMQRESATFELVVSDGIATSVPDAVTIELGSDILPPENVALFATAAASSQDSSTGQTASKAIDGIVDGSPSDYTREWATVREGVGAWIELSWTTPQIVDWIVLADRPNLGDWIVAGILSFSDGYSLTVGPLHNDGSWTSISFPARRITSIRLDVTAVGDGTVNVGLAEFMVFSPSVLPGNLAPVAVVGVEQHVGLGEVVMLHGEESYDVDGDPIEYTWTQVAGPSVALSGASTSNPIFTTPTDLDDPTLFAFDLVVFDGTTYSAPMRANVFVSPPVPENVALRATASASSETAGTLQTAAKVIDGVVDGAPGDYTREWATASQGAGAWIELHWAQPQSVDRVILYDRPNGDDNVLGGILTFSDGSMVTVGQLSNDGSATTVIFAPRSISSVRFTITSVSPSTGNVGLAELEVWSIVGPIDLAPVAVVGPDQSVEQERLVTLSGDASYDPEGQGLSFSWTQVAGPAVTLSDSTASNPTFTAPSSEATELELEFTLVVYDGTYTSTPATVRVVVLAPPPPPAPRNLGRSASATASSAASQQEASKAIDGFTDGYPVDGTHEWSSNHEGAGAWIQLTWPVMQISDRIVLYDRPNSNDHILAATLTFSDGFEIQIGALDNEGGPVAIDFSPRYFLWIRVTIDQVSNNTMNVGLAEIEVLEVLDLGNLPPVASVGGSQSVAEGAIVTLEGDASYDPEGEPLSYEWMQILGPSVALSSFTAPNPTFVAPADGLSQQLIFQLVVSDGVSWSDPATVTITVLPPTPPANLALLATATASSENVSTGQVAASAIDGVVEGYSNGSYVHEWVTLGQRDGAWIQLDWASPQSVRAVVLYDRPNLSDHILGGLLEFSDGTSVPVGALDNAGGGVAVRFDARNVTWIRFTVTETEWSTNNVGLSEIEVNP